MDENRFAWWKIAIAIVAPVILVIPAVITIAGFLVVFNYGWAALGITQPVGYTISLAVLTVLLGVLYVTHRRSPNARIWLALPLFTIMVAIILGVSAFGFSDILAGRLVAIAALLGLYFYLAWIVWTIFADI